jgi:hypothetical protein
MRILSVEFLFAFAVLAGVGAGHVALASDDGLPDRVESAREIDFREPVPVARLDGDAFRERVAALLDEEFTDDRSLVMVDVLGILELLPAGYPLEEALADELASGAAAIYDPRSGEIVLPETGGGSAADRRLAHLHELAHALADQHFDLSRRADDPSMSWRLDAHLAYRALAEGDAVLASLIASGVTERDAIERVARSIVESIGGLAMASGEEAELPPILVAQIYEPYGLGLEVVLETWLDDGWEGVEALWNDPPLSTEQLLHADRRDDVPRPPENPAEIRDAGKHVGSLELGELGVRLWLAQRLDADDARRAAEGWDGDRADLFALESSGDDSDDGVQRERTRVVWTSIWDDDAEAREFARAAERWLWDGSGNGTEWQLRRRGDRVIVSLTPPVRETIVLDEDPWSDVEFTGDSS